jgi:hypothetical protein
MDKAARRARKGKTGTPDEIIDTCGEKALVAIRKDSRIVHAELMPSINDSEMNNLKQAPWSFAFFIDQHQA